MKTVIVGYKNKCVLAEQKEFSTKQYKGRHGETTVDIICPFCGVTSIAYLWSLAGSGKKCGCGAKFTYLCGAYKILKPIQEVKEKNE